MKIFRKVAFQICLFSPLTADGVQLLASRAESLTTEKEHCYQCDMSLCVSSERLYAKEERSTLCQGIDPRFTCH